MVTAHEIDGHLRVWGPLLEVIDRPEDCYFWHRHGGVYIGASHGLMRVPAMQLMMSIEDPQWWGECTAGPWFFYSFIVSRRMPRL